jgi:hypothetical protein
MWSLVVGALAGVLGLPSDPVAPYEPPREPFSCVVPAGSVQPDPCAGLDRRPGVSCVVPALFRGSLVTCPPGPRPEGRTVPLGR